MYNCLKISILALLFLSCREDNEPRESCLMIFSDSLPVQFWPIECSTYNQHLSDGVHHKCFCQPWNCDDPINFQSTETSDSSPDVPDDYVISVRDESGNELLSLPMDVVDTGTKFVYNLSITPSELSPEICNEIIQFVARNETTGTDIAQSDCQDIQTAHKNTVLVNYRNHRNIFGLIYADLSPDVDFNIRIPAVFYHQKFPKEEETMSLSTSLVSLNSVVRRQRFLDVDYVPYYFHEKIQLILAHQFVNIYNREWVTQEEYEVVEGDRRWPVKKGKCWISEKEFVQRNVL